MMEAARRPDLRVIDGHGEVQDLCPDCLAKDLEKTRLTRSYEATLRNQREEIERLRDDQDAEMPHDEPAENVMARWHELATAGDDPWYTGSPSCGPTSTRWRDTKRALRGTKVRGADTWDWPPRSEADLLAATEGNFIRGDQQRHDSYFKREYLDPCSAFFANFDRNFEAATNPPPVRPSLPERKTAGQTPPVQMSPFDRAVRVLRKEYGHDRILCVWNIEKDQADTYMVPCPIHPDDPVFLVTAVAARGPRRDSAPVFSCASGCAPSDIAAAVRELERRQEVRHLEAVSRATAAEMGRGSP